MILTWRRFLVPGLSTLLMLLVLIGLGTWQVYRLEWKEGILAQIAAAEAAPPVPLTPGPLPAPYQKVSATGHFRFDQAAQFGAEVRDTRAGPTMGFCQIVPLERDGAPPILVDRGWVPQKRETPLDDPAGVVTVTGFVRPRDEPHWFSPADDPAARVFYTLDPHAIGAAIGVAGLMPFTLVALGSLTADSYPAPAQHLPRPTNNHLSYIVTWYGLAVALTIIFVVWIQKALRS
jgi:surfeit locus 1 family protein